MLDIRRRTGVLFGALMIGHVILISAQVQSKSGVRVLEAVTFGVFSRIQGGTASVISGVRDLWGNYVALRGVRAENEALRKQLAEVEVRLQELLDLRTGMSVATLAAEVIAGSANPGMMTVTIDRGSADGLSPDMAVVASKGIVGRIVAPLATHAARVQLLIDRHAPAGALTGRTRAGGL